MNKSIRLTGLIAAAFTPMKSDAMLDLDRIPSLVEHLLKDGVSALYVLGSTGEGVSLTLRERQHTAAAFVQAAAGRVPVVVHVGHNSLQEAQILARHAQQIGANAISAVPPYYFKPDSTRSLVDCLAMITAGAPDLPFYYYHIPVKTGVELDLNDFLHLATQRLHSLVGVKFSDTRLHAVSACPYAERYDFVCGVDEMLLDAWMTGMRGAVGTTYNFAAPLYNRLIACCKQGQIEEARRNQARASTMIKVILKTCGRPGFKAVMGLIGQDCGPHRLPHSTATPAEISEMHQALEAIGFFEWGRKHTD
ncbi:MAG: hypothetical protein TQ37_02275 [Candidatus Synechococcus spongiarum 15L]|uniref:N-acetylneuraminate lyase n=1 Tax=Candidatus Synechococcus spongiarum 15L TaxID=1608419 RepID=A0A0G8AYK2_9SYNE|nr:MAG: hypothetical protein TQ37_02275 [Candidatus Synechococcus spongiarum 15L]MCY4673670.1 dihydrodipicolinate synthase family protein [Bacteroidota bacterium]